jgi:tetratricopeptide (TPR) repeat protein
MDRYVEAEASLAGLGEQDKTGRVMFLLGVARLAQGNFEGALEVLEQVGEDSPLYTEALTRRALALVELDRLDEGVQLLESFLQNHPGDVEITLSLASLLQSNEQVREAADLLKALMEGAGSEDARVYFSLGSLYDKLGEWERSIETMEALLVIEPDHAHALNYLGYTWAEHGVNLEEAERVVRRALELLPENGAIIDSLGWALYKQGRYEEALVEMERAVARLDKDPIIWEHLGDVLVALEENGKALEAYEKAVAFDPDNSELAEKVEKLK